VPASPDVYDAGRRRLALAGEIRDRERDGWSVVDRRQFDATLVHVVRPPWYLAIVGAVLAMLGGGDISRARYLHVEAFDAGRIYRATIGDVPSSWPKKRRWEVPDGWASLGSSGSADQDAGRPRDVRD
jgi:hypothetical protein